jgi:pyruvate dehydrogenase E2 component (dihydrolipoamide acetyltransferase)
MADFLMPSLGADMEAATLVEWRVKPGDSVKRGEVVASVETAKGIIDIEIFADGVIESLLAAPGADVPVGGVLARYRETGPPALGRTPAAGGGEPRPVTEKAAAPSMQRPAESPRRRLASPAARRRANELGIDMTTVAPQGGGAITLQDVERAAAGRSAAPSDMRALIAHAMSRSKREIPHYYLATTIDMRRALRWLEHYNAVRPVTERLLYGLLLLKAVALTLRGFPELNGFWRNQRFEPSAAINVGIAIRLRQGGLVAPALLAADERPLPELMSAFQDVVQRARGKGLRSTELASATITVSSLGEGSVETVYPIIHPPQVAIVGFGGIVTRPWCDVGAVVPASVITATLSADHRVSDGHRGSAFVLALAERLQNPEAL